MEKKVLLFVVQDAIYENDGYKARLEMEMGLLKDYFKFLIFAPKIKGKRTPTFLNEVEFDFFESSSDIKPYFLDYINARNSFVKELSKLNKDTIIVFEGMQTASLIYDICEDKGFKYIYDCHGSMPSEIRLYHNSFIGTIYSKILSRIELKLLSNAEICITVSNNQYDLWNRNINHITLPMLPSDIFFTEKNNRCEIRKKLNIKGNERVFVYSGQNQKWQMSEETIRFYKRIEENNKNTFLLILTHDEKAFEDLISKYRIKKFLIMSVQYNDMPYYLDACDYGFCLRANDMTNIVASPTKVLEYLARNIRPIITSYVGDFSSMFMKNGFADVVNIEDTYVIDNKHDDFNGQKYVKELKEKIVKSYISSVKALIDS